LAYKIPEIIPAVDKAIEVNPNISEKQMKDQFEKLILEPLLATQRDTTKILTRVIVIDALDECERDDDSKPFCVFIPDAGNLVGSSTGVCDQHTGTANPSRL
jgi:hypothetical protein